MGLCLSAKLTSSSPLAANRAEATAVMSSRDDDAVEVPELTLRELNNATLSFSNERLIGKGFRSTVFRASLRGGKDAVAKRIDLQPYGASDCKRHISAASRLRHESVVRLLGYSIVTADKIVLLYELATMGTLHDVLHGGRGNWSLSWVQRVRIALHTAKGLEYLHDGVRPPVTHGSVRSSNVLLFEGFRAKIADNDMLKIAWAEHTGREPVGYLAAEDFMMGLTRKSDVFGFGVVLLELLTGRKAFDQTLPVRILVKWATPLLMEDRVKECIDPKLGDQYDAAGALKLARIAARCVQSKPSVRPSMGTVAREISNDIMRGQQGYGAVLEG